MSDPFIIFSENNREPVVLNNIDEKVYHSNRHFISKHALDIVHDCPAKFHLWQQGLLPDEETPALRFGSALHAFVLEPDRFWNDYAILPPEIKTRKGKAFDEFVAENTGKEIISADELNTLDEMHMALCRHPKASALLAPSNGKPEQTVLFTHRHYGFNCKARIDRVLPDAKLIVDLKTCTNASPDAFTRAVINFRYHVQGAFYVDAMKEATGDDYDFAIVAVEKEPPFMVAVYLLTDWLALGRDEYKADFETLSRAVETDTWRGYEVEGDVLKCPEWYLRKFYKEQL